METKPWHLSSRMLAAVREENCEAIEAIIDKGFDVDNELVLHKSAIYIAIESGNFEIAKILTSRNCSLSLKTNMGSTPLHLAVQTKHFGITKLLLENRADVTHIDLFKKTPLHLACEMNSDHIALLLIHYSKQKAINLRDIDGRTPLHLACHCSSISITRALLQKGANINAVDRRGNNALWHAVNNIRRAHQMVRLLLDNDVDVNRRNNLNETALLRHLTIMITHCHPRMDDVCIMLIEHGSDVNATSESGDTPLHIAVSLNKINLVQKLLNYGSNVNAVNKIGLVPLSHALKKRTYDISMLLFNAGADLSHFTYTFHEQFMLPSFSPHASANYAKFYKFLFLLANQCQSLSSLCRLVIRQTLGKNIEEGASKLPLPKPLVKFIQLLD